MSAVETTGGASIEIDRSSPVPLYHQVALQLERAIVGGELGPGDRLVNEVELADQLRISRPTARRAIQQLVDKGLLLRKRGVGTRVVHNRVSREVQLSSLYDDLVGSGQSPTTEVLRNEVVPAPADVAEELGVGEGVPVRCIERLRLAAGEPLALLRNWLPVDLLEPTDAELRERGLYQLVRARGVQMRIARQRIGARRATPAEAGVLDEDEGAPLLTMRRTTLDDTGRVVEFGDHVYRAESYGFETTLIHR